MDGYRDDMEITSKGGKVFRYIILIVAFVVYVLIFYRIFVSCDTDTAKTIILDNSAEHSRLESFLQLPAPNGDSAVENTVQFSLEGHVPYFTVFTFDPTTTMDAEGRLQLRNPVYLDTANCFQLALRVNTSYHATDENGLLPYNVLLRVTHAGGTYSDYPVSFSVSTSRANYTTIRYGFNDINFVVGIDSVSLIINDGDTNVLTLLLSDSSINTVKENPYKTEYHYLEKA